MSVRIFCALLILMTMFLYNPDPPDISTDIVTQTQTATPDFAYPPFHNDSDIHNPAPVKSDIVFEYHGSELKENLNSRVNGSSGGLSRPEQENLIFAYKDKFSVTAKILHIDPGDNQIALA